MIEQEAIDWLRDYQTPDMGPSPTPPTVGLAVYVKGHSSPNDGGGGIFIWSRNTLYLSIPDNDGTIINPRVSTNPYHNQGRWVRQIDGHVNVRYFGALGVVSPGVDDTDKIQAAIDFAAQNVQNVTITRGNVVYLPNGEYSVRTLVMRNGVTLLGDSSATTVIRNLEPKENLDPYLLTIDKVGCQIRIEGIKFLGDRKKEDASIKGCFFFTGGIWNSNFKDVAIYQFNGHCIYLQGGDTRDPEYKLTNQFTVFENVRAVRNGVKDMNSLRITGSAGQLTFLNCNFDAYTRIWEGIRENVLPGINVYIKGYETYHYPAVLQFLNSTFQLSQYAVYIDGADTISLDTCWFEFNEISIHVANSRSINVLNSRFSSGASFSETIPMGTGRCIVSNNSQMNVQNNFVVEPRANKPGFTFLSVDTPERLGTNLSGNYYEKNSLSFSYGVLADPGTIGSTNYNIQVDTTTTMYYTDPVAGGLTYYIRNFIDMGGNKAAYVTGSTDIVKVITSSVNAGEYLYIRAKDHPITFDNTGNIFMSFKDKLDIKPGECAVFIRVDTYVMNPDTSPDNYNLGVPFRENYNLVSVMVY